MTHLLPLLSAALIAVGVLPPVPGDRRPADRDAIRAHIDEIFRAYMAKDRETVRRTHAAEWRGFIGPSRTIVRGVDDYMRHAEPILASPGKLKGYEITEFDVLFYGDMAMVPYIAKTETEFEGVSYPSILRVFDVYVKSGGHWNQVASQVATHPDALAAQRQKPQALTASARAELLAVRDAVWQAWFTSDEARLRQLLPPELITMSSDSPDFSDLDGVLAASRRFVGSGARLVKLEFPRTEIRAYGDVAILYTTYIFELEQKDGQRRTQSGRGTEVFVRRDGAWVHPSWHLDSVTPAP
jgi:ketosteroid isomerase-like protein